VAKSLPERSLIGAAIGIGKIAKPKLSLIVHLTRNAGAAGATGSS
jgi:hypothetical protein